MAILTRIRNALASKNKDVLFVLGFELHLLIIFGLFVRYEEKEANFNLRIYPMFQDVHVMIFIGFGYLMTFLKRYGFSAVGFNFLLGAIIVQWAIICEGFFEMSKENHTISINMSSLLRADIAAATALIAMGAVLGNTSYMQLVLLAIQAIPAFAGNSYLCSKILKAVDAGDSIFVHTFGAYYGLAVSYVLGRKKRGSTADVQENQLEGSSYTSDLFAMIGTIFLWLFWPSFNSAELQGDQQMRAIINTYLSLTSCCVTAFAVSAFFTPNRKFDMVHIQNSTLAGGVAVGTSANLLLQPYGALVVGMSAGVLSVFGFSVLTPFLNKTLHIHDTCGVHNLHGMPGILAGLIGALMAALATENDYHSELYEVFPARTPIKVAPDEPRHLQLLSGDGRTAGLQAAYQILAVVLTLIASIISGLITGFMIRNTSSLNSQDTYMDDTSWRIHDDPILLHGENKTENNQTGGESLRASPSHEQKEEEAEVVVVELDIENAQAKK